MPDDTKPPVDLAAMQADWIAGRADATFDDLLAAGPAVFNEIKVNFPTRFAALEMAHRSWVASGRPSGVRPTAAPATAREPIAPASATPSVATPDPASVGSISDLVALGPSAFNAFRERFPERFDEIARARGLAPSRP